MFSVSFKNLIHTVSSNVVNFFKIPSRLSTVEKSIALLPKIMESVQNTESNLITFNKTFQDFKVNTENSLNTAKKSFEEYKKSNDDKLSKIRSSVNDVGKALGVGLEAMSAAWVSQLLFEETGRKVEVIPNYKFPDDDPDLKNWEVDAIAFDPLVIVEVTTRLEKFEQVKVERFLHLKSVLEARTGKSVRAYFGAYRFLNDKLMEELKKNNVSLVNANDFWKETKKNAS